MTVAGGMPTGPAQTRTPAASTPIDLAGLIIAGIVNTIVAPAVVALVIGPGLVTSGGEPATRAAWIAAHPDAWRLGWATWLAVTLTFAWGYIALAPHLARPALGRLAIAAAVAAASVDLVGITVTIVAVPPLAAEASSGAAAGLFGTVEAVAFTLVSGVAFGVYTVAGLLLVVAAAGSRDYPRWLLALGWAEWGFSGVAVLLLGVSVASATPFLGVGLALYGPWVWANAWWIWRSGRASA